MKQWLTGIATGMSVVLAAGGASADGAARASLKDDEGPSWTGCYFGVNAGGVWGGTKFRWTGITEDPTAFAPDAATVLPAAAKATLDDSGLTGGGQLGCNHQMGAFVFGVEGDLQYAGLKDNRSTTSVGTASIPPGLISESFSGNWLSTWRASVGFASGPWLLYGTGGLATASLRHFDQVCLPTAAVPGCSTASDDGSRIGRVAGVGVEWMLGPKWILKAEYLHVDLGNATSNSLYAATAGGTPFPNATIVHGHDLIENIARAGVNYRFGQ
jgi:outer membrane immunogenic protein